MINKRLDFLLNSFDLKAIVLSLFLFYFIINNSYSQQVSIGLELNRTSAILSLNPKGTYKGLTLPKVSINNLTVCNALTSGMMLYVLEKKTISFCNGKTWVYMRPTSDTTFVLSYNTDTVFFNYLSSNKTLAKNLIFTNYIGQDSLPFAPKSLDTIIVVSSSGTFYYSLAERVDTLPLSGHLLKGNDAKHLNVNFLDTVETKQILFKRDSTFGINKNTDSLLTFSRKTKQLVWVPILGSSLKKIQGATNGITKISDTVFLSGNLKENTSIELDSPLILKLNGIGNIVFKGLPKGSSNDTILLLSKEGKVRAKPNKDFIADTPNLAGVLLKSNNAFSKYSIKEVDTISFNTLIFNDTALKLSYIDSALTIDSLNFIGYKDISWRGLHYLRGVRNGLTKILDTITFGGDITDSTVIDINKYGLTFNINQGNIKFSGLNTGTTFDSVLLLNEQGNLMVALASKLVTDTPNISGVLKISKNADSLSIRNLDTLTTRNIRIINHPDNNINKFLNEYNLRDSVLTFDNFGNLAWKNISTKKLKTFVIANNGLTNLSDSVLIGGDIIDTTILDLKDFELIIDASNRSVGGLTFKNLKTSTNQNDSVLRLNFPQKNLIRTEIKKIVADTPNLAAALFSGNNALDSNIYNIDTLYIDSLIQFRKFQNVRFARSDYDSVLAMTPSGMLAWKKINPSRIINYGGIVNVTKNPSFEIIDTIHLGVNKLLFNAEFNLNGKSFSFNRGSNGAIIFKNTKKSHKTLDSVLFIDDNNQLFKIAAKDLRTDTSDLLGVLYKINKNYKSLFDLDTITFNQIKFLDTLSLGSYNLSDSVLTLDLSGNLAYKDISWRQLGYIRQATNGLTKILDTVSLGGNLNRNTTLDLDTFSLKITNNTTGGQIRFLNVPNAQIFNNTFKQDRVLLLNEQGTLMSAFPGDIYTDTPNISGVLKKGKSANDSSLKKINKIEASHFVFRNKTALDTFNFLDSGLTFSPTGELMFRNLVEAEKGLYFKSGLLKTEDTGRISGIITDTAIIKLNNFDFIIAKGDSAKSSIKLKGLKRSKLNDLPANDTILLINNQGVVGKIATSNIVGDTPSLKGVLLKNSFAFDSSIYNLDSTSAGVLIFRHHDTLFAPAIITDSSLTLDTLGRFVNRKLPLQSRYTYSSGIRRITNYAKLSIPDTLYLGGKLIDSAEIDLDTSSLTLVQSNSGGKIKFLNFNSVPYNRKDHRLLMLDIDSQNIEKINPYELTLDTFSLSFYLKRAQDSLRNQSILGLDTVQLNGLQIDSTLVLLDNNLIDSALSINKSGFLMWTNVGPGKKGLGYFRYKHSTISNILDTLKLTSADLFNDSIRFNINDKELKIENKKGKSKFAISNLSNSKINDTLLMIDVNNNIKFISARDLFTDTVGFAGNLKKNDTAFGYKLFGVDTFDMRSLKLELKTGLDTNYIDSVLTISRKGIVGFRNISTKATGSIKNAKNGISIDTARFILGGRLDTTTVIDLNGYDLSFNKSNTKIGGLKLTNLTKSILDDSILLINSSNQVFRIHQRFLITDTPGIAAVLNKGNFTFDSSLINFDTMSIGLLRLNYDSVRKNFINSDSVLTLNDTGAIVFKNANLLSSNIVSANGMSVILAPTGIYDTLILGGDFYKTDTISLANQLLNFTIQTKRNSANNKDVSGNIKFKNFTNNYERRNKDSVLILNADGSLSKIATRKLITDTPGIAGILHKNPNIDANIIPFDTFYFKQIAFRDSALTVYKIDSALMLTLNPIDSTASFTYLNISSEALGYFKYFKNGIVKKDDSVYLGGKLTENTTIKLDTFEFRINKNKTLGNFKITGLDLEADKDKAYTVLSLGNNNIRKIFSGDIIADTLGLKAILDKNDTAYDMSIHNLDTVRLEQMKFRRGYKNVANYVPTIKDPLILAYDTFLTFDNNNVLSKRLLGNNIKFMKIARQGTTRTKDSVGLGGNLYKDLELTLNNYFLIEAKEDFSTSLGFSNLKTTDSIKAYFVLIDSTNKLNLIRYNDLVTDTPGISAVLAKNNNADTLNINNVHHIKANALLFTMKDSIKSVGNISEIKKYPPRTLIGFISDSAFTLNDTGKLVIRPLSEVFKGPKEFSNGVWLETSAYDTIRLGDTIRDLTELNLNNKMVFNLIDPVNGGKIKFKNVPLISTGIPYEGYVNNVLMLDSLKSISKIRSTLLITDTPGLASVLIRGNYGDSLSIFNVDTLYSKSPAIFNRLADRVSSRKKIPVLDSINTDSILTFTNSGILVYRDLSKYTRGINKVKNGLTLKKDTITFGGSLSDTTLFEIYEGNLTFKTNTNLNGRILFNTKQSDTIFSTNGSGNPTTFGSDMAKGGNPASLTAAATTFRAKPDTLFNTIFDNINNKVRTPAGAIIIKYTLANVNYIEKLKGKGNFIVPTGVTSLDSVIIVGSSSSMSKTGFAGAGGEIIIKSNMTVTPGASISYNVGNAGKIEDYYYLPSDSLLLLTSDYSITKINPLDLYVDTPSLAEVLLNQNYTEYNQNSNIYNVDTIKLQNITFRDNLKFTNLTSDSVLTIDYNGNLRYRTIKKEELKLGANVILGVDNGVRVLPNETRIAGLGGTIKDSLTWTIGKKDFIIDLDTGSKKGKFMLTNLPRTYNTKDSLLVMYIDTIANDSLLAKTARRNIKSKIPGIRGVLESNNNAENKSIYAIDTLSFRKLYIRDYKKIKSYNKVDYALSIKDSLGEPQYINLLSDTSRFANATNGLYIKDSILSLDKGKLNFNTVISMGKYPLIFNLDTNTNLRVTSLTSPKTGTDNIYALLIDSTSKLKKIKSSLLKFQVNSLDTISAYYKYAHTDKIQYDFNDQKPTKEVVTSDLYSLKNLDTLSINNTFKFRSFGKINVTLGYGLDTLISTRKLNLNNNFYINNYFYLISSATNPPVDDYKGNMYCVNKNKLPLLVSYKTFDEACPVFFKSSFSGLVDNNIGTSFSMIHRYFDANYLQSFLPAKYEAPADGYYEWGFGFNPIERLFIHKVRLKLNNNFFSFQKLGKNMGNMQIRIINDDGTSTVVADYIGNIPNRPDYIYDNSTPNPNQYLDFYVNAPADKIEIVYVKDRKFNLGPYGMSGSLQNDYNSSRQHWIGFSLNEFELYGYMDDENLIANKNAGVRLYKEINDINVYRLWDYSKWKIYKTGKILSGNYNDLSNGNDSSDYGLVVTPQNLKSDWGLEYSVVNNFYVDTFTFTLKDYNGGITIETENESGNVVSYTPILYSTKLNANSYGVRMNGWVNSLRIYVKGSNGRRVNGDSLKLIEAKFGGYNPKGSFNLISEMPLIKTSDFTFKGKLADTITNFLPRNYYSHNRDKIHYLFDQKRDVYSDSLVNVFDSTDNFGRKVDLYKFTTGSKYFDGTSVFLNGYQNEINFTPSNFVFIDSLVISTTSNYSLASTAVDTFELYLTDGSVIRNQEQTQIYNELNDSSNLRIRYPIGLSVAKIRIKFLNKIWIDEISVYGKPGIPHMFTSNSGNNNFIINDTVLSIDSSGNLIRVSATKFESETSKKLVIYSLNNGLSSIDTGSGPYAKLGGRLVENTTIDLNGNDLVFESLGKSENSAMFPNLNEINSFVDIKKWNFDSILILSDSGTLRQIALKNFPLDTPSFQDIVNANGRALDTQALFISKIENRLNQSLLLNTRNNQNNGIEIRNDSRINTIEEKLSKTVIVDSILLKSFYIPRPKVTAGVNTLNTVDTFIEFIAGNYEGKSQIGGNKFTSSNVLNTNALFESSKFFSSQYNSNDYFDNTNVTGIKVFTYEDYGSDTGTFEIPSDVEYIDIAIVGGGGAARSATSTNSTLRPDLLGGGSGGQVLRFYNIKTKASQSDCNVTYKNATGSLIYVDKCNELTTGTGPDRFEGVVMCPGCVFSGTPSVCKFVIGKAGGKVNDSIKAKDPTYKASGDTWISCTNTIFQYMRTKVGTNGLSYLTRNPSGITASELVNYSTFDTVLNFTASGGYIPLFGNPSNNWSGRKAGEIPQSSRDIYYGTTTKTAVAPSWAGYLGYHYQNTGSNLAPNLTGELYTPGGSSSYGTSFVRTSSTTTSTYTSTNKAFLAEGGDSVLFYGYSLGKGGFGGGSYSRSFGDSAILNMKNNFGYGYGGNGLRTLESGKTLSYDSGTHGAIIMVFKSNTKNPAIVNSSESNSKISYGFKIVGSALYKNNLKIPDASSSLTISVVGNSPYVAKTKVYGITFDEEYVYLDSLRYPNASSNTDIVTQNISLANMAGLPLNSIAFLKTSSGTKTPQYEDSLMGIVGINFTNSLDVYQRSLSKTIKQNVSTVNFSAKLVLDSIPSKGTYGKGDSLLIIDENDSIVKKANISDIIFKGKPIYDPANNLNTALLLSNSGYNSNAKRGFGIRDINNFKFFSAYPIERQLLNVAPDNSLGFGVQDSTLFIRTSKYFSIMMAKTAQTKGLYYYPEITSRLSTGDTVNNTSYAFLSAPGPYVTIGYTGSPEDAVSSYRLSLQVKSGFTNLGKNADNAYADLFLSTRNKNKAFLAYSYVDTSSEGTEYGYGVIQTYGQLKFRLGNKIISGGFDTVNFKNTDGVVYKRNVYTNLSQKFLNLNTAGIQLAPDLYTGKYIGFYDKYSTPKFTFGLKNNKLAIINESNNKELVLFNGPSEGKYSGNLSIYTDANDHAFNIGVNKIKFINNLLGFYNSTASNVLSFGMENSNTTGSGSPIPNFGLFTDDTTRSILLVHNSTGNIAIGMPEYIKNGIASSKTLLESPDGGLNIFSNNPSINNPSIAFKNVIGVNEFKLKIGLDADGKTGEVLINGTETNPSELSLKIGSSQKTIFATRIAPSFVNIYGYDRLGTTTIIGDNVPQILEKQVAYAGKFQLDGDKLRQTVNDYFAIPVTFLEDGTFLVTQEMSDNYEFNILVVGGGGGGATRSGGGGGGGGIVYVTGVKLQPKNYTIRVGQGGSGGKLNNTYTVTGEGQKSRFGDLIVATGGKPGERWHNKYLNYGGEGGYGKVSDKLDYYTINQNTNGGRGGYGVTTVDTDTKIGENGEAGQVIDGVHYGPGGGGGAYTNSNGQIAKSGDKNTDYGCGASAQRTNNMNAENGRGGGGGGTYYTGTIAGWGGNGIIKISYVLKNSSLEYVRNKKSYRYEFNKSTTFNITQGMIDSFTFDVIVVGGGGRGGVNSGLLAAGGGGGGGLIVYKNMPLIPYNYTINVGKGAIRAETSGGLSSVTRDVDLLVAYGGSSSTNSTGATGGSTYYLTSLSPTYTSSGGTGGNGGDSNRSPVAPSQQFCGYDGGIGPVYDGIMYGPGGGGGSSGATITCSSSSGDSSIIFGGGGDVSNDLIGRNGKNTVGGGGGGGSVISSVFRISGNGGSGSVTFILTEKFSNYKNSVNNYQKVRYYSNVASTFVVSNTLASNYYFDIMVVGGGGGGAGSGDNIVYSSGGGGGGVVKVFKASLSAANYTITVGNGGIWAYAGNGNNGSASTFVNGATTLISAGGGNGGVNLATGEYAEGGAGGTVSIHSSLPYSYSISSSGGNGGASSSNTATPGSSTSFAENGRGGLEIDYEHYGAGGAGGQRNNTALITFAGDNNYVYGHNCFNSVYPTMGRSGYGMGGGGALASPQNYGESGGSGMVEITYYLKNPTIPTQRTREVTFDFYTQSSFVVTSSMTSYSFDILAVGGGGGGGYNVGTGGGGGGIVYARDIKLLAGTYRISVGGKGFGSGNNNASAPTAGGNTSIIYNSTTLLTANGGSAGSSYPQNTNFVSSGTASTSFTGSNSAYNVITSSGGGGGYSSSNSDRPQGMGKMGMEINGETYGNGGTGGHFGTTSYFILIPAADGSFNFGSGSYYGSAITLGNFKPPFPAEMGRGGGGSGGCENFAEGSPGATGMVRISYKIPYDTLVTLNMSNERFYKYYDSDTFRLTQDMINKYHIDILAVGGGGGGHTNGGGAAGGTGVYINRITSLVQGNYAITIGSGGYGGFNGTGYNAGVSGGTTTITLGGVNYVSVAGGSGGVVNSTTKAESSGGDTTITNIVIRANTTSTGPIIKFAGGNGGSNTTDNIDMMAWPGNPGAVIEGIHYSPGGGGATSQNMSTYSYAGDGSLTYGAGGGDMGTYILGVGFYKYNQDTYDANVSNNPAAGQSGRGGGGGGTYYNGTTLPNGADGGSGFVMIKLTNKSSFNMDTLNSKTFEYNGSGKLVLSDVNVKNLLFDILLVGGGGGGGSNVGGGGGGGAVILAQGVSLLSGTYTITLGAGGYGGKGGANNNGYGGNNSILSYTSSDNLNKNLLLAYGGGNGLSHNNSTGGWGGLPVIYKDLNYTTYSTSNKLNTGGEGGNSDGAGNFPNQELGAVGKGGFNFEGISYGPGGGGGSWSTTASATAYNGAGSKIFGLGGARGGTVVSYGLSAQTNSGGGGGGGNDNFTKGGNGGDGKFILKAYKANNIVLIKLKDTLDNFGSIFKTPVRKITNVYRYTIDGSYTFTPVSGRKYNIIAVGGGGGGASNVGGGGGGGGVVYLYETRPNTAISYTINVGAGNAGGAASANNAGVAGGNTTFIAGATTVITASGGSGGSPNNSNGTGGAGGTVTLLASGSNLIYNTSRTKTGGSGGGSGMSLNGVSPTYSKSGNSGMVINGVHYGPGGGGATWSASATTIFQTSASGDGSLVYGFGGYTSNTGTGAGGDAENGRGGGGGGGDVGYTNKGAGGKGGNGSFILEEIDTTAGTQYLDTINFDYYVFKRSGTFEVTAKTGSIDVLMVGGGGSGGNRGGGGGGGGFVFEVENLQLPPAIYNITVGEGGAGQTNSQANGNDGSPSSISGISLGVLYTVTAPGGKGGSGYNSVTNTTINSQGNYPGGAASDTFTYTPSSLFFTPKILTKGKKGGDGSYTTTANANTWGAGVTGPYSNIFAYPFGSSGGGGGAATSGTTNPAPGGVMAGMGSRQYGSGCTIQNLDAIDGFGGGGGGTPHVNGCTFKSGKGGSGIVILRVRKSGNANRKSVDLAIAGTDTSVILLESKKDTVSSKIDFVHMAGEFNGVTSKSIVRIRAPFSNGTYRNAISIAFDTLPKSYSNSGYFTSKADYDYLNKNGDAGFINAFVLTPKGELAVGNPGNSYPYLRNSFIFKAVIPSDERLKTQISKVDDALQTLLKLNPVTYFWKDSINYSHRRQIGFVAQEVELHIPDIISTSLIDNPLIGINKSLKSLTYSKLSPFVLEAIKHQKVIEDNLDVMLDKVSTLKDENDELIREINSLLNK